MDDLPDPFEDRVVNGRPPDCDFCKIVDRQIEADRIYEDEATLAFAPLAPAVRGHTLVIPKIHLRDFLDGSEAIACNVSHTTRRVAEGIGRALNPAGFNVITSAGEAATQTVFHFHVHVVPRWKNDRMGDIWPRPSEYLEEIKDDVALLIRKAIQEISQEAAD